MSASCMQSDCWYCLFLLHAHSTLRPFFRWTEVAACSLIPEGEWCKILFCRCPYRCHWGKSVTGPDCWGTDLLLRKDTSLRTCGLHGASSHDICSANLIIITAPIVAMGAVKEDQQLIEKSTKKDSLRCYLNLKAQSMKKHWNALTCMPVYELTCLSGTSWLRWLLSTQDKWLPP